VSEQRSPEARGTPRGLYALKPWYTRRLRVVVDGAAHRGISPDVFTALGVVAAVGAGAAIAVAWWPVALVLLAARLAGANLDGAVARARGVSRPWGFVLNEVGDRASDLAMFAGLTLLAVRTPEAVWVGPSWPAVAWVLTAAVAAGLPTFASLAAAGAGAPRLNGGPFGKTERCLAAVVAAAVPTWLPAIAALVAVGSLATAAVRLVRSHDALGAAA